MSSPQVQRVAVIGFGSAGAAAALTLKRFGFHVELFERAAQIGPIGAGILLHPSGQAVLDRLGILEEVAGASERIERIEVSKRNGRRLLSIGYDETHAGRAAYGVERSVLFAALERQVKQHKIPLRLGCEISALPFHPLETSDSGRPSGGRTACVDVRGEELARFDLVLLCDGARSALRAAIVPWQRSWKYAYGARWTIGSSTRVRGRLHQVVDGTRHLIGVLPTGRNRASFFWGTSPQETATDFPAWRNHVLKLCPEAAELLEPLNAFSDLVETKYFHLFSGAPHHPGAVPLGDCWHAMSPHLGQGTNLALLDGYTFATSLGKYDGDLLRGYQDFLHRRRGNNRVYQTMSFCFSPFFQSGGRVKGALRDFFLPLIANTPWIRRHMISSISGLKFRFLSCRDLELPDSPA